MGESRYDLLILIAKKGRFFRGDPFLAASWSPVGFGLVKPLQKDNKRDGLSLKVVAHLANSVTLGIEPLSK